MDKARATVESSSQPSTAFLAADVSPPSRLMSRNKATAKVHAASSQIFFLLRKTASRQSCLGSNSPSSGGSWSWSCACRSAVSLRDAAFSSFLSTTRAVCSLPHSCLCPFFHALRWHSLEQYLTALLHKARRAV